VHSAHLQVSSKSRTLWYALLEVTLLLAVTLGQVAMITRFFKSGKIRISLGV
jgi:hypothetical protein